MQQNEEMNHPQSPEVQPAGKKVPTKKQQASSESGSDQEDMELDRPENKEAIKEEQEDDVASDNLSVHSK